LFDAETIEGLASHFEMLLRGAVATPAEPASALSLLSDVDDTVIAEWSRARMSGSAGLSVHARFEAQAQQHPDRVAVTFEGESVTYAELNRRANRLAHELRAAGAGADLLVVICLERSVDLVVAILGVLKSGAGYLPLDPSYPADRLAFMLADAAPSVVITASTLANRVPASGAPTILVDQPARGGDDASERNPCCDVQPHHLAYVIYTSGSTGRPKGVMVTHRNVSRLFDSTDGWFGFGARDVWTLFHSYAFDFSVWELWGALAYGGRLVVVPYVVSRSPEAFLDLLRTEGVTVLNQTPSAFRPLMAAAVEAPVPLALRYVIFGGEALEPATLRPWFEAYGEHQPQLINMYGITETTVHVTYRPIGWREVRSGQGSVIGRPIPDLSLQVLDGRGRRVPVGVPGEIHVGGDGVARGYLNRPELTAQRFIPDRFTERSTGRLYRSGDLARWRRDGDLEYLGRIDDQVKLRGFRIELGEIESAIAGHPGIRESVVLFADDPRQGKRLVGYYTSQGAIPPTATELRAFLLARLPDYMVPSAWQRIEVFPLTPNGKVDRAALPVPEATALDDSTPYVAPRGSLEEVIAGLWSEVLGVSRVSVEQDFFALGGHSLLATQVVARVARLLRTRTTLRMLFDHPTVRGLAAALMASSSSNGQLEKIAAAVLRLREMSPTERDGLRAGAGQP
jgi:amino acid adenylation domain-containing protein